MVTTRIDAYTMTEHCLRLAMCVIEKGKVYLRTRWIRDTQDTDGGGWGSWFSIIWLNIVWLWLTYAFILYLTIMFDQKQTLWSLRKYN